MKKEDHVADPPSLLFTRVIVFYTIPVILRFLLF
jgi:hypothetical protein